MPRRAADDIFNDACELDVARRSRFLDEACGDDAELRTEVEALLALYESSSQSGFMSLPHEPGAAARHADTAASAERARTTGFEPPTPIPTPPPLPLEQSIGRYDIIEMLGRGGMGVVYLVEDPTLKRRVALKTLPRRLMREPDMLARFEREAQLLASLNHPHIATIHSLEQASGEPFITMEYVPGDTLSDRLGRGPLPVDETVSICRQIASALEAAHRKDVIHRDLKPLNIKLTAEGEIKVLDFGLAKSLVDDATPEGDGDTKPGMVMGSPGFMCPEQLRGEPADPRADIWAFGCVVYQCLTGAHAFAGDSPAEVIAATLGDEPNWGALPESTPPRLRKLLVRCLEKDQSARLSEIREARAALEAEIAHGAVPVAAPAPHHEKPNNLPRLLDDFVGRSREKNAVCEHLAADQLVTLVGPGGAGKTRLALEVAHELAADGYEAVWLVELAPVGDPTHVPQTLATTLGVKEERRKSIVERVTEFIGDRSLLVVIDNAEHVLEACTTTIDTVLRSCQEVRFLVTSRESLNVGGEINFRLAPLPTPGGAAGVTLAEARGNSSVELFVTRARAQNPRFELTDDNVADVVRVCDVLDGLPLAIELAAARIRVLSIQELADRLSDRFRILTSGQRTAIPHHQTLRALIDWSYEHLTESEQALFRRLSVFSGGWTLDAAEALGQGRTIAGWEVLDIFFRLIEKSLVELDPERTHATDQPRYRMLETVRAYARDRLREEGEEATALQRHLEYFTLVAEEAEPHLTSAEQTRWLARLAADHDNLRSALDTSTATPDSDAVSDTAAATTAAASSEPAATAQQNLDFGLRLAGAVGRYWFVRGHWSEGRAICREILRQSNVSGEVRAKVLRWVGNFAFYQGDLERARAYFTEGLELARRHHNPTGRSAMLLSFGNLAESQSQYDEARSYYEEALEVSRSIDDDNGVASVLNNLGLVSVMQERLDDARAFYTESLRVRRRLGDEWAIATTLSNLGEAALRQDDLDFAERCLEESIEIQSRQANRWGKAATLNVLGQVAERRQDIVRAASLYGESLMIFRELDNRRAIHVCLEMLAQLAIHHDDVARGVRMLAASEAVREHVGIPLTSLVQQVLDDAERHGRRVLGDGGYEAEWQAGLALTLDEVVELARPDVEIVGDGEARADG